MVKYEVGQLFILRGEGINRAYQDSIVEVVKINENGRPRIKIISAPKGGTRGAGGYVDDEQLHPYNYTNKEAKCFLLKR